METVYLQSVRDSIGQMMEPSGQGPNDFSMVEVKCVKLYWKMLSWFERYTLAALKATTIYCSQYPPAL